MLITRLQNLSMEEIATASKAAALANILHIVLDLIVNKQ
jgi:hypothetical protein